MVYLRMTGIYKITSPTKRVYIGQSVDIKSRFAMYRLVKHSKKQVRLYRSFIKHGIEKHKFEILTECSQADLNKQERYYQDLFHSTGNFGLNCKLTGYEDRSGEFNAETKEKIRVSQLGKIIPQHVKDALRKANTGRKKSPETIAKFKKAFEGRKYPKEYGEKVSRGKLAAMQGKDVLQYTRDMVFVKEYFNVMEAVRQNKYSNNSNIYLCANGVRPTAYNYIWVWKDKAA